MFVGVRNVKRNKSGVERLIEYVHSVVYQKYISKYLRRLREMIIFSPRLENYQFPQPP